MSSQAIGEIEKKVDTVVALLQYVVAIELWRSGLTQQAIAKHLHVAKAKVAMMLKGVKREG